MGKKTIVYKQDGELCITRLITFRCNNKCISCIADREEHFQQRDPSLKKLKWIFKKCSPNATTIDLNGGEPTLREDLFELLLFLKNRFRNSTIQLLTNARMFSIKEYCRNFVELDLQPFNFLITLYGHNAKVHDAVTRTQKSFVQTTKGIRNLLNNNQNIEIRLVINKLNYKHIIDMVEYVAKNFPTIFRLAIINLKLTGEAEKNKKLVIVPYEKIVPSVVKALQLHSDKVNIELFHFPKCILPEKFRKFARGLTMPKNQAKFATFCKNCMENTNCSGLWNGYVDYYGFKDLKLIKDEEK
ncbi:MAG: 4Fe-4S cluster-binding domain-containing protein [Nanoarchaeota archaeon]|nr:4Fe-4S cluster-binding domain-containing protein [Nanoarchaeota archaeon]